VVPFGMCKPPYQHKLQWTLL